MHDACTNWAYAAQRGVSRELVAQAIASGLIERRRDEWVCGRGGGWWWIDTRQADASWGKRRAARAAARARKLALQEKREAARLVPIQAKAVLMQMEVEQLRAPVVDRREAAADVQSVCDEVVCYCVRGAASDDGSDARVAARAARGVASLLGSGFTPKAKGRGKGGPQCM